MLFTSIQSSEPILKMLTVSRAPEGKEHGGNALMYFKIGFGLFAVAEDLKLGRVLFEFPDKIRDDAVAAAVAYDIGKPEDPCTSCQMNSSTQEISASQASLLAP